MNRVQLLFQRLTEKRPAKDWQDLPDVEQWVRVKEYDEWAFGQEVIRRIDRQNGCMFAPGQEQYFFKDVAGRSLWQSVRIWSLYLMDKGITCEEWVVDNVPCVIWKSNDGFKVADLEVIGKFASRQECLKQVAFLYGAAEKFKALKYRKFFKKKINK